MKTMDTIEISMNSSVISSEEMKTICDKVECSIMNIDTDRDLITTYKISGKSVICFYALGESIGRKVQKIFNY